MKIGIIQEAKVPPDNRCPLSPEQCREAIENYGLEVVVQPSEIRCFTDKDFEKKGIAMQSDLKDCDVILGVKEVPTDLLLEKKTYLFFSHTIKKQDYNKPLLKDILHKKIRLIDYEKLTKEGSRIIAFGRWAGIVGAYNGLIAAGKKLKRYDLKRAHLLKDFNALKEELKKVSLPPDFRITLTGGGRVAQGAMEILNAAGIKRVDASEYLKNEYTEAVYTQLNSSNYHIHKEVKEFDLKDFYKNPKNYKGTFYPYWASSDMLIAGAFWDPDAPVLFNIADIAKPEFRIKIIADITCDIEGSIPTTIRASTIEEPFYDIKKADQPIEVKAFSGDESTITVMAVDNLPNELASDASKDFGNALLNEVIPELQKKDSDIILRATIATEGLLTPDYQYLSDWVHSQ